MKATDLFKIIFLFVTGTWAISCGPDPKEKRQREAQIKLAIEWDNKVYTRADTAIVELQALPTFADSFKDKYSLGLVGNLDEDTVEWCAGFDFKKFPKLEEVQLSYQMCPELLLSLSKVDQLKSLYLNDISFVGEEDEYVDIASPNFTNPALKKVYISGPVKSISNEFISKSSLEELAFTVVAILEKSNLDFSRSSVQKIEWVESDFKMWKNWLPTMKNVKSIGIHDCKDFTLNNDFSFLKNLEELSLTVSHKGECMIHPSFFKLSKLKKLTIYKNDFCEKDIENIKKAYPFVKFERETP